MTQSFKRQAMELVQRLPEDSSIDFILYEVDVLAAILQAEEEIDRGETIPHAEVVKRMNQWSKSSGRHALPQASNE